MPFAENHAPVRAVSQPKSARFQPTIAADILQEAPKLVKPLLGGSDRGVDLGFP